MSCDPIIYINLVCDEKCSSFVSVNDDCNNASDSIIFHRILQNKFIYILPLNTLYLLNIRTNTLINDDIIYFTIGYK